MTFLVRLAGAGLCAVTLLADSSVIDDLRYADEAAARAVWEPMQGSLAVSVTRQEGRPALRLPCNFAGTKTERASWDRRVGLDLSSCRGIELELFCRDASPVSYFSIYFQSGEGWYHKSFFPEDSSAWNRITLDKAAFVAEGQPAGWGQIRTIRLSAWRGLDTDTEFYLGGLRKTGVLGPENLVAIIRGKSDAPQEARAIEQYAEAIMRRFEALGVGYGVVGEAELTAERLQPAQLAILPYNPSLSDRAAEELGRFVNHGGKLLAFYLLPDRLHGLLGIREMKHLREPRPGYFAGIRAQEDALTGAPPLVRQRSWNINSVQPLEGGRVWADWLDDQGRPTGQAAIVGSTNGLLMTHVLLSDDADNQRRLLLALAGHLASTVWQQAATAALRRVGRIGRCQDFEAAATAVAQGATNNPRAFAALAAAREGRATALRLASENRFPEALDQAAAAGVRLREAWCLAQTAEPGEFRAFWCHSAFGVEGLEWDEAIARLARNGFTAILPNMLWGGAAFYPSTVLPVAPQVSERGDPMAKCVAACRQHGLQVHVWKVNWNLGRAAPKQFVERLRREARLQADSRGQEEPWLCPSHPANQQLEIDAMLEVARRYDVDGLHFDYIRYPDADHCFCAGCKGRFERATGSTLTQWPKEVLTGGSLRARWLEWRRTHISAVVKAVSDHARALRPRLKVSAAVFRNWPSDRDTIGQDWKAWCDQGWLDFVCPMDYTDSHRQFENLVARQIQWTGRVPCYPGIGESASASRLGADGVIEQIHITRRYHTGGFVIFNYGVAEATDLLPLLGLGITAKR